MEEPHCGVHLPVVSLLGSGSATGGRAVDEATLQQIPEEARPAVAYLLQNPNDVGLAAYEVGREAEGTTLNADAALPLASVVKVIHLVAYATAVQTGELAPESAVPLAEIERYYLPNSDLGAHPQSVEALREEERVSEDPPSVALEDVPRMMIEYSSNAATDYLHMLLGQERIEQTAVSLGLTQQTAPCPFLGQFLLMGNDSGDTVPVQTLLNEPQTYSREVMRLTTAYSTDTAYRQEADGWFSRGQRPNVSTQRLFSEYLNTHGSAREYAALMASIATNQVGPWEQNVRIRRYLEWPTHIPANQEELAWLGYKGGSLPSVLTVVYYAQPWDTTQPVVVALFFHNLPTDTYREWRRSLPHDELARWLLRDREAIPLLNRLIDSHVAAGAVGN